LIGVAAQEAVFEAVEVQLIAEEELNGRLFEALS
jgi:hypothetical protein